MHLVNSMISSMYHKIAKELTNEHEILLLDVGPSRMKMAVPSGDNELIPIIRIVVVNTILLHPLKYNAGGIYPVILK